MKMSTTGVVESDSRVPEKVHKNFSPRLHDSCKFDASGIFNFSSPHTQLRLTASTIMWLESVGEKEGSSVAGGEENDV